MPHAKRRFYALIGLYSLLCLTGCAASAPSSQTPAPVFIQSATCPAPEAPFLPLLNANLPLDGLFNVGILLERDDILRQYIQALLASITCYEAQGVTP